MTSEEFKATRALRHPTPRSKDPRSTTGAKQMTNDKDSAVLLPCPFCGGVQIEAFHHIDRGWGASWHVQCVAKECGNSTYHHDTEAAAIAVWNTRQPTQSDAAAFLADIREPSAAMIEKGYEAYYTAKIPQHPIAAAFSAMIDAALQGQSK